MPCGQDAGEGAHERTREGRSVNDQTPVHTTPQGCISVCVPLGIVVKTLELHARVALIRFRELKAVTRDYPGAAWYG